MSLQQGLVVQDCEQRGLTSFYEYTALPSGEYLNARSVDSPPVPPEHITMADACQLPGRMDARMLSWTVEIDRLMTLAWPLVVQGVLGYTSSLMALAFVGHMKDEAVLSGVVLANSFFNITAWSLMSGLASGLETLCGQAYGSKNYKLMGLALQRALLMCFCVCIPISVLWTQMGPLLLALHQDPVISDVAARYMIRLLPSLWAVSTIECLRRYLTAQNVVQPATVITAATTLLSPVYYYFFIYWLAWGIEGAAYAFDITFMTMALLLVGYTAWREHDLLDSPMQAWPGWTRRAWSGWGAYLKLAGPATIMVCMEWWLWELIIFMSGYLPNRQVAVGVMGIAFQISAWVYMFPLGLGIATNTRVANELGAGNAEKARRASTVGVTLGFITSCSLALLVVLLRRQIAELMCNSSAAVELSVRVAPVLALTFVGDGMNSVLWGVIRASGRQVWGAIMSMCSYWVLGFPLAMFFGFYLHLNVVGLWGALAVATTTQALVCSIIILCFNWQLEVRRAEALVSQHVDDENRAPLLADELLSAPAGEPPSRIEDEEQPVTTHAGNGMHALGNGIDHAQLTMS